MAYSSERIDEAMLTKIKRGAKILKNQGPSVLASKIFEFVLYRTKVGNAYWNYRDSYTLSVNDVTVHFLSRDRKSVNRNKSRHRAEKEELDTLLNEAEEDDVFFDIGANTGLYTCFLAEKLSDGTVVAFEPYPLNIDQLEQNISLNSFQNTFIKKCALSDSTGTLQLSVPVEDEIGYGTSSIGESDRMESIDIRSHTGDNLIREDAIPQPNLVKIDVEGAEKQVIDGLENALSSDKCKFVQCEVHLPSDHRRPSVYDFGSSPEEVKEALRSLGFTLNVVSPTGARIHLEGYKR